VKSISRSIFSRLSSALWHGGAWVAVAALMPASLAQQIQPDTIPVKNWPVPKLTDQLRNQSTAATVSSSTGLVYIAITPCRVMDTRAHGGSGKTGAFGPPALVGGQMRTVPVLLSNCGVPVAVAYSMNFVTVTPVGQAVGWVAAWQDDTAWPGTVVLNAPLGGIIGNSAIVAAGADGGIQLLATNDADLVIDMNGYYVQATTIQGPSGPQGPAGFDGATGPAGPAGSIGPVGSTGALGPAGVTGPAGTAGPVGATGTTGLAGPTGATGATGLAGPAGATGATGLAGPAGATGANGLAGPAGATGANGLAGPAGATGATGLAGPAGATGANGLAGPAGATGANGLAGPAGATGATGLAGPAGATGATGPVGATGPGGSLAFADFYALMPGDNSATIAVGADVLFPQTATSSNTTIARINTSTFNLAAIGTYQVMFQVSVTEPGQLNLTVNGTEQGYTVSGRATGTSQIVGMALVTTTLINSALTVRNPAGNSTALTITPLAGGASPVSAHLVITQIH